MKLKDKVLNVFAGLGFLTVWVALMDVLISSATGGQFFRIYQEPSTWNIILYGCILAPLFEELAFRVFPIEMCRRINPSVMQYVILLSSLAFGWWHDYGYNGILLQGMYGIVWSYIYIKNEYCYTSSVLSHSLWNTMVYFGFKLIGN